MFPRALLLAPLVATAAFALDVPAADADAARGRELYVQRCGECHASSVHGRENRVARSLAEVRTWVRRWSGQLRLGWGEPEVEDVAAYLNATYYRFTCDTASCRALSQAPGGAPR